MMKTTVRRPISQQLARAASVFVLVGSACALVAPGAAEAAAKAMPACPAPVVSGATATVTCSYTGAAQYWRAPAGVTRATFVLYGAAGGTGGGPTGGGEGGSGAEVTGTLPVTPGTVLQVNAGHADASSAGSFGGGAPGGSGGGGGGGASDIRDGAYTLADRLLVAGGGGGGGSNGFGIAPAPAGGAGGDADSPGGTGGPTVGSCGEGMSGGRGGGGGAASMGGAGGTGSILTNNCQGPSTHGGNGTAGGEGTGGAGGDSPGFGGGGGGGGYYGGGGGGAQLSDDCCAAGAGGGGGGASYTGTATGASVNDDPASRPGANGEVIITYHPVLTVTNHRMPGRETSVSCLTAARCAAVGSRGSHGVVVTLAGGAQSHAAVLRGSSVIYSVSCPARSGNWAIGHPDRGTGAYLVKISSSGRPAAERTLPVPTGTMLGAISCASMTSCQVAGTDNRLRPAALETGTWNGTRLHLYRVKVTGSTQLSVGGISCWHSDCETVGSALAGPAGTDLILTTKGGKPATLNADSGYALTSIWCISATRCYAAGAAVLVTVTNGVPAGPQAVAGGWNGNAIGTGTEVTTG